ncbi:lycopene cyclase domain-containing protein [Xylanimonas oleitrophica]|uniref:Lycopene cyclase domain-containing protein n=1 Tax=Xylanimonas oleitrophica TaxID=2607479 RepID=A0A2W5X1J8_9MICO|nr:lycopene cyclase domain-containing protein [Xylanimonas oleitrophica]PZR54165.1 lycopene cyclase domain-containing protein [Xylanimonas oleitrophica]
MSWVYLACIVGSTVCMGLVDHRWRLFLFARPGRAAVVVGCGALVFLLWDVVAIAAGVYQRGQSPGMTGIEVAPELPLEEIFFVVFLCYLTMVLHRLVLHLTRSRRPR